MLAGDTERGPLRVALATTHLPLRQVADALTPASLTQVIRILHHELKRKYGLAAPRILVTGLNPHAGEGGTWAGKKSKSSPRPWSNCARRACS